MNRREMIQKLRAKNGLTAKQAAKVVAALFGSGDEPGILADALSSGESVAIQGFGAWTVKSKAARNGTSPATGKAIRIAARRSVGFKAGKGLKKRLAAG